MYDPHVDGNLAVVCPPEEHDARQRWMWVVPERTDADLR